MKKTLTLALCATALIACEKKNIVVTILMRLPMPLLVTQYKIMVVLISTSFSPRTRG